MSNTTNRDSKYINSKTVQGGLLDVVMALKANIMKSLNVATLAEVQQIDTKTKTLKVKPIPLIEGESEKNIECFTLVAINKNSDGSIEYKDLADYVSKRDIVLVVFLNRNSSQVLTQAKNKQKFTTLKENDELHSDKFGIVIGIVNKYN